MNEGKTPETPRPDGNRRSSRHTPCAVCAATSRGIRLLVALALCLLLAATIGVTAWRPGREADGIGSIEPRLKHEDCRACHAEVWNQWEASFHSRAWKDPNVQAAFQHFGFDRQCQSCHAPQPVFATGLDRPVELRGKEHHSGVNCLSCHGTTEGGVAARRTVADAPCRPVARRELTASRTCGTCHTAIYDDWKESRYQTAGQSCHDCHMPPSDRREIPDPAPNGQQRSGGRSHRWLGGHDAATVRSGATMACRREQDELVVAVHNHATGHNFPGERHNRLLLVQVIERNADGEITLSQQQRIKGITPFRGESSADVIRADETFEARFPVVDPPVEADIRLIYKAFPWQSDRQSLVVHQVNLTLGRP
jgi:hypothetical protein